jgi:hypothetical protein
MVRSSALPFSPIVPIRRKRPAKTAQSVGMAQHHTAHHNNRRHRKRTAGSRNQAEPEAERRVWASWRRALRW